MVGVLVIWRIKNMALKTTLGVKGKSGNVTEARMCSFKGACESIVGSGLAAARLQPSVEQLRGVGRLKRTVQ